MRCSEKDLCKNLIVGSGEYFSSLPQEKDVDIFLNAAAMFVSKQVFQVYLKKMDFQEFL